MVNAPPFPVDIVEIKAFVRSAVWRDRRRPEGRDRDRV
jgi:hypothetical protein